MTRDCYPLTIALPDGTRAQLIPGSRPPRYTIDGEELAIDVSIPADLVATGWHWLGSFLCQPHPPGTTGNPGLCIMTSQHPPPGWNYTTSGRVRVPVFKQSIFVTARYFDVCWREYQAKQAAEAAKPKKTTKPKKRAPVPDVPPAWQPEPELLQPSLFDLLEAA